MGNSCLCIGLFVMPAPYPPTCYDFIRDHRLLGIHSDMLHNHRLLTFTSMTVESVNQHGKAARCFVSKLKIFGFYHETLLWILTTKLCSGYHAKRRRLSAVSCAEIM